MKKTILIFALTLGVLSCEKKDVEPRFKSGTDKKFRVADNTGYESITIDGVTTTMGTMKKVQFVDSVKANLPLGVKINDSKSSWYFVTGYESFEVTGEISVIDL